MAVRQNEIPLESKEQEWVFQWIKANQIKHPKLQLAYSTLNGVSLQAKLCADMKRQGNKKGVPDIVLPVKSYDGSYPGLYIELKRLKGGSVSKEQKEYLELLRAEGYRAEVAKGHVVAVGIIKEHLGISARNRRKSAMKRIKNLVKKVKGLEALGKQTTKLLFHLSMLFLCGFIVMCGMRAGEKMLPKRPPLEVTHKIVMTNTDGEEVDVTKIVLSEI